jgi:hypothetical protein
MAPSTTGSAVQDAARSYELAEAAVRLALGEAALDVLDHEDDNDDDSFAAATSSSSSPSSSVLDEEEGGGSGGEGPDGDRGNSDDGGRNEDDGGRGQAGVRQHGRGLLRTGGTLVVKLLEVKLNP